MFLLFVNHLFSYSEVKPRVLKLTEVRKTQYRADPSMLINHLVTFLRLRGFQNSLFLAFLLYLRADQVAGARADHTEVGPSMF